jgi:hypothetical protein
MATPETYGSRKADYDNYVQRSQWMAGGVAAVLAVGSQLFVSGCGVLAATLVTVALLAGACAAYARVEFAWAASELELGRLQVDADERAVLPRTAPEWPGRAEGLMVAGLLLLVVAGGLLIALAWDVAL